VSHTGLRLKEAEKLGFQSAVLASGSAELPKTLAGTLNTIESLMDLVVRIAGSKPVGQSNSQEE
jgi:DNA repair protein RadA/Sms